MKLGDAIKAVESEYGDLLIRERQKREQPKGRSGDSNAGRGKKKDSAGLDRKKLEEKYPSLRRRVAAR